MANKEKSRWRNWQKCRLSSMYGTFNSMLTSLPDAHSLTDWEKQALLQLRRDICTTLAQWDNSTNKMLSK